MSVLHSHVPPKHMMRCMMKTQWLCHVLPFAPSDSSMMRMPSVQLVELWLGIKGSSVCSLSHLFKYFSQNALSISLWKERHHHQLNTSHVALYSGLSSLVLPHIHMVPLFLSHILIWRGRLVAEVPVLLSLKMTLEDVWLHCWLLSLEYRVFALECMFLYPKLWALTTIPG